MSQFVTSESVTAGHPDKVADQISDAVVDTALALDPEARVACECAVMPGKVLLFGEITVRGEVDYERVARTTIREIGYTDPGIGFDADSCEIELKLGTQSPDIARGVDRASPEEQGAGDQGMMYGFACREGDLATEFLPLPVFLAHRLVERLESLRRSGELPWLRPDGKSQVTVEYDGLRPVRVHTVVVSTQHAPDVESATIEKAVVDKVVGPVVPERLLRGTIFHVNPTGRFVVGGPAGDCGLTGRKIIVDTYGGVGRHGGGAFSGKDPSKVDRSAAYAMRWIAKNIVAADLARRCETSICYAIGRAEPIAFQVDTSGTGSVPDARIEEIVRQYVDLRPASLIRRLDLKRPIYRQTARNGHFGRHGDAFTWERTDLVEYLRRAAGASRGAAASV